MRVVSSKSRLGVYIDQRILALEGKLETEKRVNSAVRFLRLRRMVAMLDEYYPALLSEQTLVELLPGWQCHPRFEAKIVPTKSQGATSLRTVREYIRDLRVEWKFPIVAFSNKKGEQPDPMATKDSPKYGYRWAANRKDLRDYKKRIRSEIKEHMLSQMERYEAADYVEGVLWHARDNFFQKASQMVEQLNLHVVKDEAVQ